MSDRSIGTNTQNSIQLYRSRRLGASRLSPASCCKPARMGAGTDEDWDSLLQPAHGHEILPRLAARFACELCLTRSIQISRLDQGRHLPFQHPGPLHALLHRRPDPQPELCHKLEASVVVAGCSWSSVITIIISTVAIIVTITMIHPHHYYRQWDLEQTLPRVAFK